ncbi:Lrp/AsnC family transcriptional regulator [Acidobacteria bacterium ACD]|nr:MAG: Lrp/AsnC family transcriptional regulator [Acidobacteriota bacterium]MCE7958630.1 Lrp/AsnC family transcriptional regulator [Acidobacteria bacterium ACB2]MDL1952017.1 Lrp/AsnC family transcriptional regulator [Acidobacteria bacterium ACD]
MLTDPAKLLDEKGWRILRELQGDARLSFAELGRRVGLSTPAVAERVRNLEAAGVVTGYRAEVDLAKVGLPILAVVRMSAVGDVLARITSVVRGMPEVLECHRATGADSFVMKVAVASVAHLEALIDRLTPFGTTSTSIVLSSPVPRRTIEKPAAGAPQTTAARGRPRAG